MASSVLLVRHLSDSLTDVQIESLLRQSGAVDVRIMNKFGYMKHCAFATFPTVENATFAMNVFHQKDIGGRRLVVEYANEMPKISADERDISSASRDEKVAKKKIVAEQFQQFMQQLMSICPADFGVKGTFPFHLSYLYPPPNPDIIQNICHTLIAVPKFYVQVLHLMNRMNLPPPFGPVTPQPLYPTAVTPKAGQASTSHQSTVEVEEANVATSSDESEIEDNDDTTKLFHNIPIPDVAKRTVPYRKMRTVKRPKLIKQLDQTASRKTVEKTTIKSVESQDIFDAANPKSNKLRISIKVPILAIFLQSNETILQYARDFM